MTKAENFTMELCCCEDTILNEISHKECKRKDIALTYYFCLVSSEDINYGKINKAIIERWSRGGLNYIKVEAWKLWDKKLKDMRDERR